MDLKGTLTEKNLWEALKGESLARNKYTFYSSKAKKDGYVQIAKIFEDTANNEKEHAKIWFKFLHGSKIPSTIENLKDCIEGEHYEHTIMYPEFAKVAKDEGFDEIAKLFNEICEIEKSHEKRYQKLLDNLTNNEVFSKPEVQTWECSNCGFHIESKEAPEVCPFCAHPRAYFFIQQNNF